MWKENIQGNINFSKAFKYSFKRYTSSFNSEYFSRQDQISFKFYDKLFRYLEKCRKNFSIKNKNFYEDYLHKSLIYSHTNINHSITSLKLDWSLRYYHIATPYLTIIYELYISYIINIIQNIIKNNNNNINKYLIESKFFWFAHQIDDNGNIQYQKMRNKFLEEGERLKKEKKYYFETDIEWFYDSIIHNHLIELLSKFMKDFVKWNEYESKNIDNVLADFNDILFKISQYHTTWIPQWLRWSDYLSILYLWLIFFYEKKDSIQIKETSYQINGDTEMILYSDDIIFFSNDKNNIFNNSQYIINLLWKYWLKINIAKTSKILLSKNQSWLKFNITKIKKNDKNEIKEMCIFILDILKNRNKNECIKEIKKTSFKTYFKWIFKINDTNISDEEVFKWFSSVFFQKKLETRQIWIHLLSISDRLVFLLFKKAYKYKKESLKFFITFIKSNENFLSDNTVVNIANECWEDIQFEWLKKVLLVILAQRSKNNPILDCFHQELILWKDKKKFFLPYCEKTKLHWLKNLMYNSFELTEDTAYYQENILWLKLHNLFWTEIDIINFQHIKELNIPKGNIYQIARVIDSLILNKYRNKVYYMKTASFIADLFSLFNQLISLLINIEAWESFRDCSISFSTLFDSKNIKIKTNKKQEKISLDKYGQFNNEDKWFLFYLQKKRAQLNHKEIKINDLKNETYNISKYENSEILLKTSKLMLEKIFLLIKEGIHNK